MLLSYRLGQPVAHTEVTTELTVSSRSAAAETLASTFGIDELPTKPDDEDDEFEDDDPAMDCDEQPADSGSAIQHLEDCPDTKHIPVAIADAAVR